MSTPMLYHRVDYELMWGQLVSQLPDLSDALSVVDASEDEPPR